LEVSSVNKITLACRYSILLLCTKNGYLGSQKNEGINRK
jgi:hypothetical protein